MANIQRLHAALFATAAASAFVMGRTPALAQAAPASPPAATQVGEVVVTARQRQETLQNVPAQVTAFTAQKIQDKGIEMPRDFIRRCPTSPWWRPRTPAPPSW